MLNSESFRLSPEEAAQLQRTENGAENGTENKLAHEDGLSPIMLRVRVAVIDALGEEFRKYRIRHTGNGITQNMDYLFKKIQTYFHTEGIFQIEEVGQTSMRIRISLPASVCENPEFAALINVIKYASILLDRLAEARRRITTLDGEDRRLRQDIDNLEEKMIRLRASIVRDSSRATESMREIEETERSIQRVTETKVKKEEALRKAKDRTRRFEAALQQVLLNEQGIDHQSISHVAEQLRAAVNSMKGVGHISNEHLSEDITPNFCITIPVEIESGNEKPDRVPQLQPSSSRNNGTTKNARKNSHNRTAIHAIALGLIALIGGAIAITRKGDATSTTSHIATSSLASDNANKPEDEPWMNKDQMHRVGRQMIDKFQQQQGGGLLGFEKKEGEKNITIRLAAPDTLKGLTSHGEVATVSMKKHEMAIQTVSGTVIPFDQKAKGVILPQEFTFYTNAVIRVPYTIAVEGYGSAEDAISIPMEEVNAALLRSAIRQK